MRPFYFKMHDVILSILSARSGMNAALIILIAYRYTTCTGYGWKYITVTDRTSSVWYGWFVSIIQGISQISSVSHHEGNYKISGSRKRAAWLIIHEYSAYRCSKYFSIMSSTQSRLFDGVISRRSSRKSSGRAIWWVWFDRYVCSNKKNCSSPRTALISDRKHAPRK